MRQLFFKGFNIHAPELVKQHIQQNSFKNDGNDLFYDQITK